MTSAEPVYIRAWQEGRLGERIDAAWDVLSSCTICPRNCRVDRLAGETGVCKTGKKAWMGSYGPHFGEEAPLVGDNGSGTIFFTHCNLMCLFCQNYDLTHEGEGQEVTSDQLAWVMLNLQEQGCHNINFVSPSHVVPQILLALEIAVEKGLFIPLVYNSGGYDSVATLHLLEDIFDIYMPDFKFWPPDIARESCNAEDYPEVARRALAEMHRQVGDLVVDEDGIARRGLLVRHLVLPEERAGTSEIMAFIASEVSADTYVNLMPQYRPCGRAAEVKGLGRCPTREEFASAVEAARKAGITRLDDRRPLYMLH